MSSEASGAGGGAGLTIPEMLGFAPVPYEREKAYSAESYRALYRLTEEEARKARDTFDNHPAIDMHLAQRYMKDTEYRARIEAARADLGATEPDQETRRVMRRLMATMSPPSQEAEEALLEVTGNTASLEEEAEDEGGAA